MIAGGVEVPAERVVAGAHWGGNGRAGTSAAPSGRQYGCEATGLVIHAKLRIRMASPACKNRNGGDAWSDAARICVVFPHMFFRAAR